MYFSLQKCRFNRYVSGASVSDHSFVFAVRESGKEDADGENDAPGCYGERPAHSLGYDGDAVGGDSGADIDTAVADTADGGCPTKFSKSTGEAGDEQEVGAVHSAADKGGEKECRDAEESAIHSDEEGKGNSANERESKEKRGAQDLVLKYALLMQGSNNRYADDRKDGEYHRDKSGLGNVSAKRLGIKHRQPGLDAVAEESDNDDTDENGEYARLPEYSEDGTLSGRVVLTLCLIAACRLDVCGKDKTHSDSEHCHGREGEDGCPDEHRAPGHKGKANGYKDVEQHRSNVSRGSNGKMCRNVGIVVEVVCKNLYDRGPEHRLSKTVECPDKDHRTLRYN